MRKWTVRDRAEREIYLTEERWQHIVSRHRALAGYLDDVVGPSSAKYFYHRRCEALSEYYNSITVVVLSRGDNRYVVTAWPEVKI